MSSPLHSLRLLIASSTTFQERVGATTGTPAENAATALSRVYRTSISESGAEYPFALVGHDSREMSGLGVGGTGRLFLAFVAKMELLYADGWTSVGWTGSWLGGWTHTPGNVYVLSAPCLVVEGATYRLAIKMENRTAGSITATVGAIGRPGITESVIFEAVAADDQYGFQVKPTFDFDGTITVSVTMLDADFEMSFMDGVDAIIAEMKTNEGTGNYLVVRSFNQVSVERSEEDEAVDVYKAIFSVDWGIEE